MNLILNKLPITRLKLFIARILFYLIKPFYGTEKRIITRNGLKFEVDIREGLDLSLFLFGNFQKHVTENRFISIPNDAVIVDVGANVGIMSLHFAKRVPNGKVYAFEPTHYAFQKLKRNIELNPSIAKIVQTVQVFISCKEKRGSSLQAFSSWKIDKSVGSDQHLVHGGEVMPSDGVPAITLDDFVKQNNIDRLDFIKIDTDGHEFDVLSGSKATIEKLKPQIIFELGGYVMEEKEIEFIDYENFFHNLNYKLSDAATNKPISSFNHRNMVPQKGTIDILAIPHD
ncbi:MAG: FkbM family methyltransferase [Cytophagales bacterium]|nr:FkbM family methyltransferase [Cytophagales bacterium]